MLILPRRHAVCNHCLSLDLASMFHIKGIRSKFITIQPGCCYLMLWCIIFIFDSLELSLYALKGMRIVFFYFFIFFIRKICILSLLSQFENDPY